MLGTLCVTGAAHAQTAPDPGKPNATKRAARSIGDDIVVTGQHISKLDLSTDAAAAPASVSVLGAKQIAQLPVSSYGDLFRPVAGVDVSNFGQGGIGYGISLRGFTDGEHGRDIGFVIDDMPINEVSSLSAPGYVDLNVLLPETVDHVEIVRGPFDIEHGDNSVGGTVNIVTKREQPLSSIGVSGGSYDNYRGLAVLSGPTFSNLNITPYAALEYGHDGGYRDNAYFRHLNSFNSLTMPAGAGVLSLRAHIYDGTYGEPGYSNRQDIRNGLISPKTATNNTDGGYKHEQDVVSHYDAGAPEQAFSFTGFFSHDTVSRSADFGGGQTTGKENRYIAGGTLRKVFTPNLGALPLQILVGSDVRADWVDAIKFPSIARDISGPAGLKLHYEEQRVGGYAQLQLKPVDWIKLTAGSRYDHFYYQVHDRLASANSFNTNTGVFSPKLGGTIQPLAGVELYGNYGEGYRSPSVVDELLANPGLDPLKIKSAEAGIRVSRIRGIFVAFDAWRSHISNEAFQPAIDLPLQNLGRSRRQGLDIETRATIVSGSSGNVALFANLGTISARLLDQGLAKFVPSVPKYIAQIGFDFDLALAGTQHLDGSVRADLIGRKNLSADGVQRTRPYQRISGKLNYSPTPLWIGFVQMTGYVGDRLGEAAFNFGDAVGATAADIFVSAQPAFVVQVGITRRFNLGS